ncbi:MAG: lytic transglycosylase domain-containing protein [Verrucomicrobiota bacterium]|jgi:membrane-bound lytic murein transglycosylase D
MFNVELVQPQAGDVPELARICFEAFKAVHVQKTISAKARGYKGAMIILFLAGCGVVSAQTNDFDLNGVLDAAQQFAQENLDPDVFRALQSVDREKVQDFLIHYQDYLHGDYVLDLAQLKDAASAVLPLLEAHEETRPYAAWLRERMDYLDAADELEPAAPPPQPAPGKPLPPPPNPPFKAERELWIRKVAPRPWPKGAAEIVPKLKAVFASEHVPPELVWLAEVESGFDARARSPAGAAGLFQLMPATARDNGLSLWPLDQRRQPEAEARAAAKDLRELHELFGDWRLAVAAYNCGAGTVQKSLERHHAKSYERIATHLPAETQMYVPKVEATILHREGVELEKLKVPAS